MAPGEVDGSEILELEPGDLRLAAALEVMRALRTDRSLAELERLLDEGRRRGEYRIAAVFDDGECRAVARAHRFYFRRGYAIESFNFGCRLEGEGA